MTISINECFLAGTLARDPTTVVQDSGSPLTSARLLISEERDGQVWKLWLDVEAYARTAERLATLREGDAVLVRGKLKWKSWERDGKKQGTLLVNAWSVQPLSAAPASQEA